MHATIREECTLLARAFAQPQKTSSRQPAPHAYARYAAQAVGRRALEAPPCRDMGNFPSGSSALAATSRTGGTAGRRGMSVSAMSVTRSPADAQGAMNGGSCFGGAVPA